MTPIDRAKRLFNELHEISVSPLGVTHASFAASENAAHEIIRRESQLIGLNHNADSIGNFYETLPG